MSRRTSGVVDHTDSRVASSASRASSEWCALRLSTTTMASGGSSGTTCSAHVAAEHVAVHASFERAGRYDPLQADPHHQREGRAAVARHVSVGALARGSARVAPRHVQVEAELVEEVQPVRVYLLDVLLEDLSVLLNVGPVLLARAERLFRVRSSRSTMRHTVERLTCTLVRASNSLPISLLAITPERGKMTSWGDHWRARGAVTRWMDAVGRADGGDHWRARVAVTKWMGAPASVITARHGTRRRRRSLAGADRGSEVDGRAGLGDHRKARGAPTRSMDGGRAPADGPLRSRRPPTRSAGSRDRAGQRVRAWTG